MAKCLLGLIIVSFRVLFDFDFFPANAMGLIPVQLNPPDVAIGEPDMGSAFELSPSPGTISFLKICQVAGYVLF
jgi:hypothetical protein